MVAIFRNGVPDSVTQIASIVAKEVEDALKHKALASAGAAAGTSAAAAASGSHDLAR